MRILVIAIVAACSLATPTAAQTGLDYPNAIGVYVQPDIQPGSAWGYTTYFGMPGVVDLYVVLTDAVNYSPGGEPGFAPIAHVGGFEFRLEMTENLFLLSAEYPAGANAVNFLTPPNFLVGCNIAVTGWATTLLHLQVMWAAYSYCDLVYLAPVFPPNVQSIPGSLAITDADDAFRLNPAFPASGDFEAPLFFFNCGDDTEDRAWGSVKSLYR
ncbi:MAG TPA: hypothetical protein PLQ13_02170 [Candidatus Krumholzibacteria bacterium]|nr:hypothetical protein [Candidatus Krumholzibacteria bacterium]